MTSFLLTEFEGRTVIYWPRIFYFNLCLECEACRSTMNWSGTKQGANNNVKNGDSEDRGNEVSEDVYYHISEKWNRTEKQTTKPSGLYFAGNTDC